MEEYVHGRRQYLRRMNKCLLFHFVITTTLCGMDKHAKAQIIQRSSITYFYNNEIFVLDSKDHENRVTI